jgi:hypothetical protein
MLIKVVLNQSLWHDVSTERDARLAIRTVQGFTLGIHVLLRTKGSHRCDNYHYVFKEKFSAFYFQGFRVICLDIYSDQDKIYSAICKLDVYGEGDPGVRGRGNGIANSE